MRNLLESETPQPKGMNDNNIIYNVSFLLSFSGMSSSLFHRMKKWGWETARRGGE